MLSSICHDIRCYEFAQTSGGTFSQANINLLAAACGGCDEPSCQDLLDMCVDAGMTHVRAARSRSARRHTILLPDRGRGDLRIRAAL
jgi:hypothetical protein